MNIILIVYKIFFTHVFFDILRRHFFVEACVLPWGLQREKIWKKRKKKFLFKTPPQHGFNSYYFYNYDYYRCCCYFS